MPDDADASDSDTGATVELALSDLHARLPARRPDLREQLPGIEPERRVTDWGRSERVEGLVDRTVYDFFYRYWFRVAVEGVENVPHDGAALLVANHSGAIPSDGPMIAKAIKEEHPRPRPVHISAERPFAGWPGIGMLFTKLGAVAAHPANLHRLLFDERELVLVFPEGPAGARKPVKERYRLRAFDHTLHRGGASLSGPDRAGRAARRRGGVAGARSHQPAEAGDATSTCARHACVPAPGEVQDPLPGAGRDDRAGGDAMARSGVGA